MSDIIVIHLRKREKLSEWNRMKKHKKRIVQERMNEESSPSSPSFWVQSIWLQFSCNLWLSLSVHSNLKSFFYVKLVGIRHRISYPFAPRFVGFAITKANTIMHAFWISSDCFDFIHYFPVAVLCCSEVQCFKRAISKRKILTFPGWIKCGGGGGRISPPDSSSGPLSAFERPRPPFIVFSSVPPFEWAFGSCTLNRTSWNSGPTSEQPREPTFCCIFEKPDGRLPANKNSLKYYLFIQF